MSHANAVLTPKGRLQLARLVVDRGWSYARAGERFGVAATTARRWAERYRLDGPTGMSDRSSRPRRCPGQLPTRTERRIVGLRVSRRWGPARIAYHLGLNPSTVHKVVTRYGCPPLRWTDPATGTRIKTSRASRRSYEHASPGDLVHVDVKKLGRIPDGGGWRFRGRVEGSANKKRKPVGYAFLHHAVDDHSRLAYSEIHDDEKKETAVAFWRRAQAHFASCGITVNAVLTDNGNAYRSKLWARSLGTVKHRRTRPYRPQTNGKAERSSEPCSAAGPTARSTAQAMNGPPRSRAGSISTIVYDHTAPSAAGPRSLDYTS
jgi:transposase-like protein